MVLIISDILCIASNCTHKYTFHVVLLDQPYAYSITSQRRSLNKHAFSICFSTVTMCMNSSFMWHTPVSKQTDCKHRRGCMSRDQTVSFSLNVTVPNLPKPVLIKHCASMREQK